MKATKLAVWTTALAVLVAGCGPDFMRKDGTGNLTQFLGHYTLQGKIMDAHLGAAVAHNDLKVKLIQGTTLRDPDRLIKDPKDPLAGEYAFGNIPLTVRGQADYKLVVTAPNYKRFEAVLDYSASVGQLLDTTYNFIGDIFLFPLGAQAPAYSVNVAYLGKPVSGAVVHIDPVGSTAGIGSTRNTLTEDPGYSPALAETTGADGRATFASERLSLGVRYRIRVMPVVFEGVQLTRPLADQFFVVGQAFSPVEQYVQMTNLAPNAAAYGLFVSSISNEGGALNADGVLTINFSRGVFISNLNGFTASVSSTGGTAAALATPAVTATLSSDGRTLTLRPNWTTRPAPNDRGVAVNHTGSATIGVAGYPTTSFPLFGSMTRFDGNTLRNPESVQVTPR